MGILLYLVAPIYGQSLIMNIIEQIIKESLLPQIKKIILSTKMIHQNPPGYETFHLDTSPEKI